MTWEGERGGVYFRLSLFDIKQLINFWIFGQKQTQLGRTSSKTHKRAR